jgi:hypothetical protein
MRVSKRGQHGQIPGVGDYPVVRRQVVKPVHLLGHRNDLGPSHAHRPEYFPAIEWTVLALIR